MKQNWLIHGNTGRYGTGSAGSVWSGTDWYFVVLGQYNLVLLGIKWNWSTQNIEFNVKS